MNETPPQSPFTTSAVDSGPPVSPSPVENTAPPAVNAELLATVVPAALAFGGVASFAVLWMLSNGSMVMRAAGAVVLISDIAAAAFLRFIFLKRLAVQKKASGPQLLGASEERESK